MANAITIDGLLTYKAFEDTILFFRNIICLLERILYIIYLMQAFKLK